MSNLEAKHLFVENRFPESSQKILSLLLYTPIGILILLVRLLSGLLALVLASALPDVVTLRKTITNLLSFTFGIFVEKQGTRDESVKILVSNHISRLDHLALHIATDSYTPTKYRMQDVFENSLGLLYVNRGVTSEIILNSEKILAFFPEETITNGKGLLKFKSKVFDYDVKIQPVALKVWRPPMAELAVKSLGSQWWADILIFMFVPYTLYTVKFLPPVQKEDASTEENTFSEIVRQAIAENLKIPATELTARDLFEYEKRYIMDQRRATISGMDSATVHNLNMPFDPSLDAMARQVKDVLPLVPHHVIIQDLAKTRNVDYTISNILDGHVRYVPESPAASTSSTPAPSSTVSYKTTTTTTTGTTATTITASTSSIPNRPLNVFPKNANERMMSFQERKRQLIETARKRYIEKHGLNIALNNC